MLSSTPRRLKVAAHYKRLHPCLAITSLLTLRDDRLAALYTDVLQADRFLLVGVQKKAPHDLWRFETSADSGLLAQGCKKYQRLLREFTRQQLIRAA